MNPTQRIDFDFRKLDLEDIKSVYKLFYFGQEPYLGNPEAFKENSLDTFQTLFESEENEEVEKITRLAALLKEGAIRLYEFDHFTELTGKTEKMETFLYSQKFEFQFDEGDYDGLNSEGKGVTSMVNTYYSYPMKEILQILDHYSFSVPMVSEK